MGLIRKITTPARPRRAARRPRSSLLAASAAAMPIRNTKNSAERLSAGRKRSSTLRGDAEGRRVSWRTVPTFAAGALATAAGAVLVWCRVAAQADSAVTDGMLRWWAGSAGGRRRP